MAALAARLAGRLARLPSFTAPSATTATLRTPAMSTAAGPVQQSIEQRLTDELQPVTLEVINESYMHNVPRGSETHFKVVVVSDKFDGLTLIKRHRLVNGILKEQLAGSVHALSIVAKTPEQWQGSQAVDPSPTCMGGMKREQEQKAKANQE